MKLAIVDYGSGNLRSAAKAFERSAREADIRCDVTVTSDPEMVLSADRVILPGVGAFGDCMRGLNNLPGMIEALEDVAHIKCRPFFGICVGMQLMATTGLEHGTHKGLGWIKGEVTPIPTTGPNYKIPHMGWNNLVQTPAGKRHTVLKGINAADHAYFVHSYQFKCANPDNILATVEYSEEIVAVIAQNNVIGTQFHPEKSQAVGLNIIKNFLVWTP